MNETAHFRFIMDFGEKPEKDRKSRDRKLFQLFEKSNRKMAVFVRIVLGVRIAAAAMAYKAPLITHNRKHFEGIEGLKMISDETL